MFRSIITGTFPFFHRMTRKYCLILAISLWWDGSAIVVRKCDKPADRLTIRQLCNTSNLLGRWLRSLTLLRWRGGENGIFPKHTKQWPSLWRRDDRQRLLPRPFNTTVYTTPLSLPRKFTSLTSHLGYRNEQIKIKRQNRPCEEYHKRYESCILEVCQLYLLNR